MTCLAPNIKKSKLTLAEKHTSDKIIIRRHNMFKKLFRKNKTEKSVKKPGWWTSPGSDILPDPPASTSNFELDVPLGKLADWLNKFVPLEGVSYTVGSSVITYNFRLKDLKHLNKAKTLPDIIYAESGKKTVYSPNRAEGAHFSLSIERAEPATLYFKNAICRKPFSIIDTPTACVMGTDTKGDQVVIELNDSLPHLLIAGQAGGGKSVLLHSLICSMLFKASPSQVKFLMVDVKLVELTKYNGLPHLVKPVITDAREAIAILQGACIEMDNRYTRMSKGDCNFPKLVIVIDELADLMMLSKSEVESAIVRLCQKGRAAGIHVIVATQSPRASVLTGLIRSNIPGRVGLRCATAIDSRICIEKNGCEKLSGRGDGFYIHPAIGEPTRFQAAYITDTDIAAVCDHWKYKAYSTSAS